MKHNAWTKLLSLMLVLVMVLGVVPAITPAAEAAEITETGAIKIDFIEFAKTISEKTEIWEDLRDATQEVNGKTVAAEGIKVIGNDGKTSSTTAEYNAFKAIQSYLDEEGVWNIAEGDYTYKQSGAGRMIFLNTTDSDYGLRFYSTYLGQTNDKDRSSLMLTVNAPKAGLYHMDLSVLNEAVTSKVTSVNRTNGRGHGDIYVNDELVYEDYAFKAYVDTVENVSFGAVQLKKGENTVRIYMAKDHFGTGSSSNSGRRACNLRSLNFIPLNGVQLEQGRSMELDLHTTYLPFDAAVVDDTYTVESMDETVARAEFQRDGDLLITGYGVEDTELKVYEGDDLRWTIPVEVVDPMAPDSGTDYYVGGFKAATFSYGATAEGDVTQYVEGEAYDEREISLENGALYYKSNDPTVVTVDQLTGNITCVGEGSTTVIAYVLLDGVITSDHVIVTVVDETDLASIEAYANVDYVAVGNALQLYTKGLKASGSKADMSLYPVAWTVEGDAATVSEDGVLTGVKEGTVTVTATAGVDGEAVTDSVEIDVVDSEELEENAVVFDFTYGRALQMKDAAIEEDGVEIDWANTFKGGSEINYGDTSGIDIYMGGAGEKLALDFMIERDGWYQVELRGKSIDYAGVLGHAVIDEQFVGDLDCASTTGSTYGEGGFRNTVYLAAGKHDFDLIARSYGRVWLGRVAFYPVADPGTPEISFTGEQTLVKGETADLDLTLTDENGNTFYLQQVTADPGYTNWYTLTSSNTGAVTVSGMTMTAVDAGTSTLTVNGELMGQAFTKTLAVTVQSGTIKSVALSADATTLKPGAAPVQLTLTAYGADGSVIALPSGTAVTYTAGDAGIASVNQSGLVTVTGVEGSEKITATVTEGTYTHTAEIWISVTEGKTEPTIYTYEERANAQANAQKYTWAANLKNTAVKNADFYVEHLEQIYDQWPFEGIPRSTQVGYKNELGYRYCRYCGEDLVAINGNYPYLVDPINNPWKITCPVCKRDFPSNDFGAYYESGLNEEGRFIKENADASLLTNDLYPEKGEGWGVDDGFGYKTGEKDANGRDVVHTYIAYYMTCAMYGLGDYDKHSLTDIMKTLIDAYLYTGEDKYGVAGAILTDRIADVYPTYDITKFETSQMAFSDGGSQRGKIIGPIWDAILSKTLARSVDAFWPCMDKEAVIEFLQQEHVLKQKGMTAEQITPEYLRTHAEDNILLEIFKCAKTDYYNGNFGMEESGVALAAVALDRLPETQDMFEWVFHEETRGGRWNAAWNTGGDVARVLTEDVSRDGFGYEVSYLYNSLWTEHLLDLADALSGYPGAAEYDLWKNPKFVNMYTAFLRLAVCGHLTPQVGEAGFVQSTHNQISVDKMLTAYLYTSAAGIQDDLVIDLARGVYAGNGNSVSGLHGTIFMADPVDSVQSAIINTVSQEGPWDFSDSDMMSGFGIAILREGPEQYLGKTVNADQFSDYWMYFGYSNTAHARLEALAIDLEAFGLGVSSHGGYPLVVSSTGTERMQWLTNTASHNTVVVDDRGQNVMWENGTPLHFEDAGQVKIMDAEAPMAYAAADIYRRTLVTVAAENGVHYAVDFFRVLGGEEHVYSFHGATTLDPSVEGLTMVSQPFGTYAGADVPFGDWNVTGGDVSSNQGSGYSWLKNVSRDESPENYFSIDWTIEDTHKQLPTSAGIHLKLHMLSEEPMTEVALAEGSVPQNGRNPSHLEYTMIRRSGEPGMDTLFTAIIEPYQNNKLIASAKLLDVELVSGTESINARAAAMKVTLVGGRQDYIIYATDPGCTYDIYEDGVKKLTFQGFAGVVSYNKSNVLTYAWGSETTAITDANGTAIVADAQAAVTGKVTDFSKGIEWDHFITVTMDEPVTREELVGRYIYVANDGVENAAYRIHDAEVEGTTARLNVNNQTLVRAFVDASEMDLGYVYNIAEGDRYTIPLSATMTCSHAKNRVSYTTNNDGTHALVRTCTTCSQVTSTSIAACKDGGTDGKCDKCGGVIPQTISTPEELIAFAEKVNAGGTIAYNAVLAADIDLTGYDWVPIGTSANAFKGVFSGAGHTISGVELEHYSSAKNEIYYLGLFPYALGATIKDLTVEGKITLSGAASTASRIGGIVGYAANTTLIGCINKVEISGVTDNETSGFGNVGGLVGYASGATILRCGNDADLIVTANNLGGLVGNVTSASEPTSIRECYNHGDIFGFANVGGLVGNLSACSNAQHDNIVADCYSSGDFETMTASGVGLAEGGGLIGRARSNTSGVTRDVVRNCYVSGATTIDVRADGDYTDMAIVGTGNSYNITNQWQDLYYLEGVSRAETYDITMAKSHEEMIDPEFVATLGSAFKQVEDRYPVLVWECGHPAADKICVDNGDGTHIIRLVCGECGYEEVYTEVCTDRDGNDYCDVCSGKLSVVDKIAFAGANMTLGNDLKLNFLLLKSQMDLSKSYTAVVTKYDADGTVDATVRIPSGKWETYAGKYFKIAYGVAAKEMCDNVMIEIFDGETRIASYEDSIRSYATRALASDTVDGTVKTMVVDMLNYGAAAQTHFKYDVDDLANSQLTEEQKALATKSVAPVNKQQKITNCYGSNLSLDDSLKINMFFYNRPADVTGMYGEISFTNHIGEKILVKLTEEDLLASYSSAVKNLCQVTVDEMVLADARQLITVTIYNADGTVYGACADSVESYVKRGMNSIYGELCISVMKFATSAYNYLHTR